MKTLKKVIRVFVLAILIILAASGALAIFLPVARERYVDKEIRIERIDKNKDEEEDVQEEKN